METEFECPNCGINMPEEEFKQFGCWSCGFEEVLEEEIKYPPKDENQYQNEDNL